MLLFPGSGSSQLISDMDALRQILYLFLCHLAFFLEREKRKSSAKSATREDICSGACKTHNNPVWAFPVPFQAHLLQHLPTSDLHNQPLLQIGIFLCWQISLTIPVSPGYPLQFYSFFILSKPFSLSGGSYRSVRLSLIEVAGSSTHRRTQTASTSISESVSPSL